MSSLFFTGTHKWFNIDDAHSSSLQHVIDGVHAGPVQVAFILPVLHKPQHTQAHGDVTGNRSDVFMLSASILYKKPVNVRLSSKTPSVFSAAPSTLTYISSFGAPLRSSAVLTLTKQSPSVSLIYNNLTFTSARR